MILLKNSLRQDEGVTAIEYALIAAFIAIVIVTSVTLIGINLQVPFNTLASKV